MAGWTALGFVAPGDFVGISGFASVDWVVSDLATLHAGGVMVPLPTNILAEDVRAIIDEAEVRCLMVSAEELAAIAPVIGGCASVKAVIVMDRCVCQIPPWCSFWGLRHARVHARSGQSGCAVASGCGLPL